MTPEQDQRCLDALERTATALERIAQAVERLSPQPKVSPTPAKPLGAEALSVATPQLRQKIADELARQQQAEEQPF